MKKLIGIFFAVYIILYVVSILPIFAWNSFGGSNSTNTIQKVITVFFKFPVRYYYHGELNVFLAAFVNALFWSICLTFFILLFKSFKRTN